MISGRTVTITGIIIVVLCAGLFFYTQQSNRKFAQQLPTLQPKHVAVDVVDQTPAPIAETTPNSLPAAGDQSAVAPPKVDTPTPPRGVDREHYSQAEIDTVFEDAFAFFDHFSAFDSINIEATRAELEALLRALHGDDPRVSEFLGDWDTTRRILSLRTEYNKNGANDASLRAQIFEMKPTEVLPKAFELGSDLIQPSGDVATQRNEWLQEWLVGMEKAEMAHFAGTLAVEAFENGEISAQEAEGFVEDVSGLDVKFREVSVTDE